MTTIITKNEGKRKLPFDEKRLDIFIDSVTEDYTHLNTGGYRDKVVRAITQHEEYKASEITSLLTLTALEEISKETPDWTYVAARVYLRSLYKQASRN